MDAQSSLIGGTKGRSFSFRPAAVEAVSADLQAYLKTLGADRLNVHRLRLSVEEILLNVMAKCGESTRIRIGIGKQFGQHIFRMQYAGASFDPTQSGEEDWSRRLMVGLGYYPCWNYRGGVNTASSLSAMPLSMKTCTEKLGVRESTVSFAYPLGSVIYMPASIASFTVVALTFASICEVDVNLSWVLRAVFTVTMLVIAMPPIPGAGLLVYTVLFAQLGIPSDALVLATAIDVVVDYCNTGFNVLLLILQVAWQGKTLGCIDREVLVKENPAPAQGA